MAPPRVATALLRLVTPHHDRACLIGDLTEEYACIEEQRGSHAASRWYWSQALRSSAPLLVARLTAETSRRALQGVFVGVVVAAFTATLYGLFLSSLFQLQADAPRTIIVLVVTSCALLSSTCAAFATLIVSVQPHRGVLAIVGLGVVAPEFVYVVRHLHALSFPWLLVPPVLSVLATCVGLHLGTRLSRSLFQLSSARN